METKRKLTCPKCGFPAKMRGKLTNRNRETYREYVCVNRNCDHVFYTIEFDAEENDDFMKAWKELRKWS